MASFALEKQKVGLMKLSHELMALCIFPLALPASAQSASAPNPGQAQKADEGKKVICRSEDRIGTRLQKRKICMTRDEWRQVNAESSMALEKSTSQLARPGG